MRGEHLGVSPTPLYVSGSPPHAWGAFLPDKPKLWAQRFTPTCVGSITLQREAHARVPVHPHMRGEHLAGCSDRRCLGGSPPHAWGACSRRPAGKAGPRFTPTCVGSMPPEPRRRLPRPVHPHMRGEHIRFYFLYFFTFGSPPHAWGACNQFVFGLGLFRFTPTCVGSILTSIMSLGSQSVHPHMRGEHLKKSGTISWQSGSPPHAWGACGAALLWDKGERFTPTCVGSIR